MLEEALYEHLTSLDIVGDRIYPTRLREGAVLPAVSFERVSARRTYTHDPQGSDSVVHARMQFDCWATSALGAIGIAREIVDALSGFQGDMDGLRIDRSDVAFEVDLYERDTKLYRRIVDIILTYEEGGDAS